MNSKILVVDDEESIRYTFSYFLSDQGYSVTVAANYEESMSLIRETDFDLVYVDIVMEGKSGIDLLKSIREIRPNVPVVIITGVPTLETAAESLRYGALDYIIKPINAAGGGVMDGSFGAALPAGGLAGSGAVDPVLRAENSMRRMIRSLD